jgi:hypothetical protein
MPTVISFVVILFKCQFGDNAPQYFDVMHGFPQIKLSEEISQEESKLKTLKDVNIVTNSVLTVNFPSV